MKISSETIAALKNFAEINQSLVIRKGSSQKTVALAKNILASVDLKESFPQDFGIYDLSELLNVLGTMDDPSIEFKEKYMIISSGSMSTRFVYSDESNIHPQVPEKSIDEIMPAADLEFELKKSDLAAIKKMSGVLSLDDIVITAVDGDLVLRVTDLTTDSSNSSDIVIGSYDGDSVFSFNYKISRFVLMPDDYEVKISSALISYFRGKTNDAEYLISLEKTSSFQ